MTPKIVIPMDVKHQIQFYVDNCDKEISGLGSVVFDPDYNGYIVKKVILLDQEVGSAHTDLDDDAVSKAVYEHTLSGEEGELCFWWHSHVNMSTFWSGQDHETMDLIGAGGLCVACVFNKKEEVRGAIVMFPDGFPAVKLDDVEVEIEYPVSYDSEILLAEIKQKVRTKSYATVGRVGTTTYHPNILSTGNEISDKEEKFWKDKWSQMPKHERARYTDFKDYLEECIWGEYSSTQFGNIRGAGIDP